MNRILLVFGAIVLLSVVISTQLGIHNQFLDYWRSSAQASISAPSDYYRTSSVTRGDVRQTVIATGTINPVVTVEVGSQLSGQLAKVFVDFNDEVIKGQPLAELDRRSFDARLAEARAATDAAQTLVAVQKSRVERARVDVRETRARTAVLEARLENTKARKVAAEKALGRVQELYSRGVNSSVQLQQAETEVDAASANFREAEALASAHAHTVAAADADLQRAEAELANAAAGVPQKKAAQLLAEIDLERTIIRSPVTGVVVGRNFSEGQTVATSLEAPTLFTIAGDLEHIDIHARVDESDIGRIRIGQKATFAVDAHPGRRFEAEVAVVRKAPVQQTGSSGSSVRRTPQTSSNVVTYTVVLKTTNTGGLLLPGMTAAIRIIVDEAKDALIVPMAALRFNPRGRARAGVAAFPKADRVAVAIDNPAVPAGQASGRQNETVWVWEKEGRLRPVSIEVGAADGLSAAVLSSAENGLQENDQVIVADAVDSRRRRPFLMRWGF